MIKGQWLILLLIASVLIPNIVEAAEDITNTIEYSVSNQRVTLTPSQSAIFLSNLEISNYNDLKDFTVFIRTTNGVSNISVHVQGQLCGSNKIGPLTQGEYLCTNQLNSTNLTQTTLNITFINHGDLSSGNDTVTLGIATGRFTVAAGISVSVGNVSIDSQEIIDHVTTQHQITRGNTTGEIDGLKNFIKGLEGEDMSIAVWIIVVILAITSLYLGIRREAIVWHVFAFGLFSVAMLYGFTLPFETSDSGQVLANPGNYVAAGIGMLGTFTALLFLGRSAIITLNVLRRQSKSL